jgi:predicted HicB family RNase H-like nuclease
MIKETQSRQISFRIPESLHQAIKREAERQGISQNLLITRIMRIKLQDMLAEKK